MARKRKIDPFSIPEIVERAFLRPKAERDIKNMVKNSEIVNGSIKWTQWDAKKNIGDVHMTVRYVDANGETTIESVHKSYTKEALLN